MRVAERRAHCLRHLAFSLHDVLVFIVHKHNHVIYAAVTAHPRRCRGRRMAWAWWADVASESSKVTSPDGW